MVENQNKPPKKFSPRLSRILALTVLALIIIAWYGGTFKAESKLTAYLKQVFPQAHHFELISGETYSAWKDQKKQHFLGYVTTGKANGYGGVMKVTVAIDTKGRLQNIAIVDHNETSSFLQRVLNSGLLETLKGKTYSDPFILGQDVDGITGATSSSRALTDGVRKAIRKVAVENLGFPSIPEPSPHIKFGVPEWILVILFITGFLVRYRKFKYRKLVRWSSLIIGMVFLGFLYNEPLTLIQINKILLGYWSECQLHLYMYILLGGFFLIFITTNKNPYCHWFCPFGAAQECLGLIGGAKALIPNKYHKLLRWFHKTLVLSVIILALLFRNPSFLNYELYGAFFKLIGSSFIFALLGTVLLTSLFIKKPWCTYLCPITPIAEFIRLLRTWAKGILTKIYLKTSLTGISKKSKTNIK